MKPHRPILSLCIALMTTTMATPLIAEASRPSYSSIGMTVNDTLFDGQDRWRTGSYQRSFFVASGQFEFRLRTEFISPRELVNPDQTTDRPYASIVSLGAYAHRYFGDNNAVFFGASADLINEVGFWESFHQWAHGSVNFSDFDIDDFRVDNGTSFNFEAGYRKDIKTDFGYVVPFVEAQYGTRTRVTGGMDLVFTQNELLFWAREQTTGNIIASQNRLGRGASGVDFVLGGDVSYVWDDKYINTSTSQVDIEPVRFRARAGLRFQSSLGSLFIGPSYISEEFVGQEEGQFVQAISFDLLF